MAGPNDSLDPLAALATPPSDVSVPWDWVPDHWTAPPPQLQPGLGIPTSVVDQAAAALPMQPSSPPPDEVDPSTVTLGFPHAPDVPEYSKPGPTGYAKWEFPGWDPHESEADQERHFNEFNERQPGGRNFVGGAQPGLGIPTETFDAAAAQAPGIPMPPVDAISGVDGLAPIDAEQLFPAPTDEMAAPPEIEMAGTDFSDPATRAKTIEQMSTPELAGYTAEHEEARRQQGVADMLKASTQQMRDAEDEQKIFVASRNEARAKRAQVESEAMRLAQEPEPERSTADTVRGVLMAIAGGLVQHLNGGRNIGLDLVDKEIAANAAKFQRKQASAKAALDIRRGAADQQLSDAGADLAQSAAYRAASWQRVVQQIDLQAQNFDPAGTTAIRYEAAKRDAIARQQKAVTDFEEAEAKRLEAEGKNKLDYAKQLEVMRKNDIDAANDKLRIRNDSTRAYADLMRAQTDAAKAKNETQLLTPEYFKAQYPNNPVPMHEMTKKEYGEFLANSAAGPKSAAEIRQSSAVAAKNERENSPENIAGELGAGDLVDANNKPLLFRDSSAAAKVAKQRAAVDNSTRLLDQLLIARKKYGWTSDLFKSEAWRAAKADIGALTIEVKNADELGALSGPDMGLIEQQLATSDPTTLQDPSAGWVQARANLVNNFNSTLTAEARPGQKPKRYEPVKTAEAKSFENTLTQNLDVWDSPLMKAKDPEIRKHAHEDAVKSADALARQARESGNIGALKAFASDLRARHNAKDLSDDEYETAMRPIRREFVRAIKDLGPGAPGIKWGVSPSNFMREGDDVTDEALFAPIVSDD